MSEDYPLGAEVTYLDETATTSKGNAVLVTGVVNGMSLYSDDDTTLLYVPVWSERDNDREATTVYVNVVNIVAVKKPDS